MSVLFKRDLDLYISTVDTGFTADNTAKISILDNYSITTNSRSSSANPNRVSTTPERLPFIVTDEIATAKIKFTTYAKPVMNTTNHSCAEKLLFDSLGGIASTEGASNYTVNFASVNTLIPLYLFISYNNKYYKFTEAVVSYANISFNIDNITSIEWELEAKSFGVVSSLPSTFTDHTSLDTYLKNKLSIVTTIWDSTTYNLPIISGNLKISNKIIFPQRKTLDITVSTPMTHIVGPRSVQGKFNCYMHLGSGQSGDFYDTIYTDYLNINDSMNISAYIGGNTEPYIYFNIPNSLIELPKQKTDDVISFELELQSRELTYGNNDDITLQYKVQ